MAKTCKAKNAAGKPCQSAAGVSGFCFTHDPARKAKRSAARKLGGLHRKTSARVSGDAVVIVVIADVLRLINAVISDTWAQDNSPARSRALLAAADAARGVFETIKLEARQDSWTTRIVQSIKAGDVDYESVVEEFGSSLATELYRTANVEIKINAPRAG